MFDSQLSMQNHVKMVCQTAYCHLRSISQIRHLLNQSAAECIVHAFITSRLDYANALLYGLPLSQLKRLQSIQNTSARIITRTKMSEHITPVLFSLHWLPIKYRIMFKILLLTFKALKTNCPSYIQDLLLPYKPSRKLRSADLGLLVVPTTRRASYGDRSFSKTAPTLWNELPVEMRATSTSVSTFKQQLKSYLFKLAYPESN